jgi:hypothetical protein
MNVNGLHRYWTKLDLVHRPATDFSFGVKASGAKIFSRVSTLSAIALRSSAYFVRSRPSPTRDETGAVILSLTVGVKPEGSGFLISGGVPSGQYVEDPGTGPQSLEHALVIGASQIGRRNVQAGQLVEAAKSRKFIQIFFFESKMSDVVADAQRAAKVELADFQFLLAFSNFQKKQFLNREAIAIFPLP